MIRTSSAPYMKAVPAPPHDPTWWLLDKRAGWHAAELIHVEAGQSGLRLTASGLTFSFKKLDSVALGPEGRAWTIDPATLELKIFDPCDCTFKVVPATGGKGSGPRQFLKPGGVGVRCGNLFVADTGNRRLSVFSLFGYVLLGAWRPPASANLTTPWQPLSVAFDSNDRVYVADPANGAIHRFSPTGRWQKYFSGLGAVTWIAIDCEDRIYVADEAEPAEVKVLSPAGKVVETISSPEELRKRFPHYTCLPSLTAKEADSIAFEKEGSFRTEPIDSGLYRCQWHRVVLYGDIPPTYRILVSTFTAETEYPDDFIAALSDEQWETNQVAARMDAGAWDCLVRSGPGRFLWLKLEFSGNGSATSRIDRIRLEFPRISLRRYLPGIFGHDPLSADFTDRFLAVFDTTLRNIEQQIDDQARLYDPASAPAARDRKSSDFLSWLASWIGVSLNRQWPEPMRRRFLARAARMYHLRGTREGLWRQLLFLLGLDRNDCCCSRDSHPMRCRPSPSNCNPEPEVTCAWEPPPIILEHFQLRRWLFVGAGRLGDQAMLWGKKIVNRSQLNGGARVDQSQLIMTPDPHRDPFHVYAHKYSVFVPAKFGKSLPYRRSLETLLRSESPAHTVYQIEYVEPRFRIGCQSMIGLDSVVGRYPQGVEVNSSRLRSGAVLPASRPKTVRRIGSTTRLD
jgi:phage tail-like protein